MRITITTQPITITVRLHSGTERHGHLEETIADTMREILSKQTAAGRHESNRSGVDAINRALRGRMKELRERQKLSRSALSELCGLSRNMIGIYERGEAEPSTATVCALADIFRVSTDYLLGRTDRRE